jgi:signal transduction histidine kinase
MMPGLDGYEVCRRVKSDPATATIPIIMVTALGGLDEQVASIEAGADEFLSKPFHAVELVARVRSLLRVKRLHDELDASKHELELQVAERTAQLRHALAELQELDRLRSQFISSVSHELRTPLMYVKGWIDLLAEGALGPMSPDQTDAVSRAQQGTRQLARMIENVLDFGQLRVASLQFEPVALAEIASDVCAALAATAAEHELVLDAQIPVDLPPVQADPRYLTQALGELMDNAIKFSPQGGQVTVSAYRDDKAEDQVVVAVSDEGPGIPPDRIAEMFNPFVQLDSSTTRRHGGVGLGLALVSLILAGHGSEIEVDSQVGVGTAFRFRLPIAEGASEPGA